MTNSPETPEQIISLATAAMVSGGVGLAFGRPVVAWLGCRYRERVKSISPTIEQLHRHKNSTPTMGGVLIVLSVVAGGAAAIALPSTQTLLAMAVLVLFALLGAVDDLVKLRTEHRGLSMRAKLMSQLILASLVISAAYFGGIYSEPANNLVGLVSSPTILAICSILLGTLFVAGSANAVNLTDGLDGLAAGCGLTTSLALAVGLSWLMQPQLAVLAMSLAAALAAFLWFNRHPAQVFMGDTGSQASGALLGYLAWMGGCPWFFAAVAAVFIVELLSVVLQLGSYRLRGKRWLRCAPLHHHFQFGGGVETTIVRRFWLAAIGCAACGVIGLIGTDKQVTEFARTQKLAIKIQQVSQLLVERPLIAANDID